jgi:signal peptide peptidase SppA
MDERFAEFTAKRFWALEPNYLRAWARLVHGISLQTADLRLVAAEKVAAAARDARRTVGQITVIPVLGMLSQRGGMSTVSTEEIGSAVDKAAIDPQVASILLEFDSPGGEVFGTDELAARIAAASKAKPVVAAVNSQATSAAYWAASAATEIVVTPSGEVGSIGVVGIHEDLSTAMSNEGIKITLVSAGENKTDGNPYEPLSEEALAQMAAAVGRYYSMFVSRVSKGRGVSQAKIQNTWRAKTYGAEEAVELGLADRIGTLSDAIQRAATLARSNGAKMAAIDVEVEARLRQRARA